MKSVRIIVVFLLLSLLVTGVGFAADARGCADHPLFNRMSGFEIFECKKTYDQLIIKMVNDPKSDRNLRPEGDLTTLKYIYKKTSASQAAPSDLSVMRNYQNAARQQGGTVLVERPGYTALKFARQGAGNVYAVVSTSNGGWRMQIDILEEKAMKQEITANLMWEKLQKDGFISLQINFDTNKATIKPESMPLVQQIVDLMKGQPNLRVSIEGHTDNVGTAAANKTLSLNRARSVASAVAAGGIRADRMETVGWGQEKPVADNRTEDGRAANRRVELVKK